MREAMAVTGYVDQKTVEKLTGGGRKPSRVDVRPERQVTDVVARVAVVDITDVRIGAAEDGDVLVQLILREGAVVETVVRASANKEGLMAFHDPVLNRVRQEATAKKIMI